MRNFVAFQPPQALSAALDEAAERRLAARTELGG
jgi:hypothetical protein